MREAAYAAADPTSEWIKSDAACLQEEEEVIRVILHVGSFFGWC